MPQNIGTRADVTRNFSVRVDQGSDTRSHTRDKGMRKRVVASLTFTASPGRISAANGTFTNSFAVGDPIIVAGTNLNNGYFTVIALDASNAAFLTVDPPPKPEGPITATVRTS